MRLTTDSIDSVEIAEGTIYLPEWAGEAPINYEHIRESFALAIGSEEVDSEILDTIVKMVDDAVVANEDYLEWPSDGTETAAHSKSLQTFEIDIVWANGSATDSNVIEFSKTDDDSLVVEYADGSSERYPYGDVVGSRIETNPESDESDTEQLVSVEDQTIHIAEPESPNEYFIIEPKAVPTSDYWDAMVLDYYYGRPVLYLREPDKEDPQFVIALPTKKDPKIRPIHTREITNDKNAKIVKEGQPVA